MRSQANTEKKILLLLSKSNQIFMQKELAGHANISPRHLRRTLKQLEKKSLIEIHGTKAQRYYTLSQSGINLTQSKEDISSWGGSELLTNIANLRKHAIIYKAELTHAPPPILNTWVPFRLRNWTEYFKNILTVDVRITTKNILFFPPQATASNIEQVEDRDRKLISLVRDELKKEGIRFGHVIQAIRTEYAIMKDPFAIWCRKQGISFKDSKISVDESKGTPELEFIHAKTSIDDMEIYRNFIHEIINSRASLEDFAKQDMVLGGLARVDEIKAIVSRQTQLIEFIMRNPLLRFLWEVQAKAEKGPESLKTQAKKP